MIRRVTSLGLAFDPLMREAEGEGHRFLRRLADDWAAGANRFDKKGELFLAVVANGCWVGVGGLNRDPYAKDAATGRLRHLYVLAAFRRQGIGAALVHRLMAEASLAFSILRLRTVTPEADRFYRELGFHRTDEDTATHFINLSVLPALQR